MATARDVVHEAALPGGRATRALREDGLVLVQAWQDCRPVLREAELARQVHRASLHLTNPAGIVRVATVPLVIVEELKRAGIWRDRRRLLAWLSDPDNRAWRTDDGRRLA
jgi:hypothetical protein